MQVALIAFLCLSALAGCSDTSFVGKRVDNFTAYYNTFYNAQRSFDEGVEQVEERQQSEPVDMNRYLNLFLTGEGGRTGSGGPFATAIQKSADVLRDHPTSKWVDESLMLIGKSYYFQQNYVGAEQKFREVQELGTDLREEARFWLVRTLVSSNRLVEAEEVSTAVLGTEETSTWTARTWLARGESLVRQARWGDAAQALSTGLSGDLPNDLSARAAFLLGQVRETLDDPSGAQSAYRRAVNTSNEYELTYAAKLSAIRVRGLNGEPEAAIEELRDMERDDKNFERLAALQVLRGRLLDEAGRPEEAQGLLRDVLYGEPPAQSTVRGRAHYAIGELYRDAYENFSRAAAHFDTASTSLAQAVTTREPVLLTPSAITNSASISERFSVVSKRAERVSRLDSLLALGQLSPDSLRARLLEIQEARLAELEAQQERQSEQNAARRFNTRTVTTNRNGGRSTTAASGSGSFLFYDNPTRVQEGRRSFQQRWGNRPRVDNWRRSAAIEQQRVQTTEPDPTEAQEEGVPVAGAGPEGAISTQVSLDISEIPRTPDEQAAMRSDRAVARYELATALFLNASRPDSAAVWYNRVLTEDAETRVAQQAIYALAEVRRSQGRDDEARERYIQLIREYPNSPYAQRARQRLGRAPVEVADSNAVAEATYAAGYRAWQSSRIDSARSEMARVVRVHPETHVAPRAVLALATISLTETRQVLAESGVSQDLIRGRVNRPSSKTEAPTDESARLDAIGTDASTEEPPTVVDSSKANRETRKPNDAPGQVPSTDEAGEEGEGKPAQHVSGGTSLGEQTARRLKETLLARRPSDDFLKDIPGADSLVAVGRDRLRDELGQNEPVSRTSVSGARSGGSLPESRSQQTMPRRAPRSAPPDSARTTGPPRRSESTNSVRPDTSRSEPERSSLSGRRQSQEPPQRVSADTTQRSLREEAASVRTRQQAPSDSMDSRSLDPSLNTRRGENESSAGEGVVGEGVSGDVSSDPRASSASTLVAEAYMPALNILAYLIARYPDAPQSERALVLAKALAERHNLLSSSSQSSRSESSPSESSPPEPSPSDPALEEPSPSRNTGSENADGETVNSSTLESTPESRSDGSPGS